MSDTLPGLTELDEARITAEAYIAAFHDFRAQMRPDWPGDLIRERQLHHAAVAASQRVKLMEARLNAGGVA